MIFKFSQRIIYTLQMSYRYRQELANIYLKTPTHFSTAQISLQKLKNMGIKVLVLDFDGVLAAHGEIQPTTKILVWLQTCSTYFEQVFLLSNKPFHHRLNHFQSKYPQVYCITNVAKKPYPEGLNKVKQLSGKLAHEIALVDDRLLTGVLAACIAQTQVVYVTSPYTNLTKRPIAEAFFTTLRFMERRYVQLYTYFRLNK